MRSSRRVRREISLKRSSSERRSGEQTVETDGIQLLRFQGGEQAGAVTETEKKRETILVDLQISSFLAGRAAHCQ